MPRSLLREGRRLPLTSLPLLVLDDRTIMERLTIHEVISLVEFAFIEDALGGIKTLPVLKEPLPGGRGTWVIKAGQMSLSGSEDLLPQVAIGLKLGGYCPLNDEHGLSNHSAVMLLTDAQTGRPCTLLAANAITALRTSAGGAIAARALAGNGSEFVGVLGAGAQAYAQLEAWNAIHPVKQVKNWARNPGSSQEFSDFWRSKGIDARPCSTVEEAVDGVGLIITVTAAREPILKREWIRPGVHINAIGADAVGKQELDANLVANATLFADKRIQSIRIGEMQKPLELGLVKEDHVWAELGEVCAGMRPGRTSQDEITIFDSTGVAFQDLVVAGHLQRLAAKYGFGTTITL